MTDPGGPVPASPQPDRQPGRQPGRQPDRPGRQPGRQPGRHTAAPDGVITRGKTHPQRLRRVDRWLLAHDDALRRIDAPLVIDLGFGALPWTSAELLHRLRARHPGVHVLGVEIDPDRVAAAQAWSEPGLSFQLGGFELAGVRPAAVLRVMNVLRQYDEEQVVPAWRHLSAGVLEGGLVVEGTCDEVGRLGSWVALRGGSSVPASLTFSAHLATLERPGRFAERLPKALIHRNVPGQAIHAFLQDWDAAWIRSISLSPYGPRARFMAAAAQLRERGWPLLGSAVRWRLGELTVAWSAVS